MVERTKKHERIMLIIKGAIYKDGDELLRAHYTGDFVAVDCTEYRLLKDLKKHYADQYVQQFKENGYLTCDGKRYYEAEWGPHNTHDFVLLSDLSEIEFYDQETDFTT